MKKTNPYCRIKIYWIKTCGAIILVLASIYAQAQKKIVRVDIPLIEEIGSYDFFVGSVIDMRTDTNSIGTVFVGMGNRKVNADVYGSLYNELHKSMSHYLPIAEGKTEITMIVYDLLISEHISSNEKALCHLEIEMAVANDTSLLSLGIFEMEVQRFGMDVTKSHGKQIRDALKRCIDDFASTNWKACKKLELDLTKEKYAFDFMKFPPNGAYLSYGQLARHLPMDSVEINLNSDNSKFPKYMLDETNRGDFNYVVQDGFIYKWIGTSYGYRVYLQSKQFGKYLYFEMRVTDPTMSVAFGLIGALASKKGRPFVIDTSTGRLIQITEYLIYQMTKNYPEILKEYRASKRKLPDVEKIIIELNAKYAAANSN